MRIDAISSDGVFTLDRINKTETPTVNFQNILSELVNQSNSTDAVDKAVNEELLLGDLQNLHAASIAAEKADIALRLTVSIRNKCVEAYSEIMRMQV